MMVLSVFFLWKTVFHDIIGSLLEVFTQTFSTSNATRVVCRINREGSNAGLEVGIEELLELNFPGGEGINQGPERGIGDYLK